MSRSRPYLHVLLLYKKLWVEIPEGSVRADLRVLAKILKMSKLMKEKCILSG
jgi:hypothetical protein